MIILVVDDEEYVQQIVERMLKKLGHTVVVTGSGRQALDFLSNNWREVDLVVSDNNMSGMTGIELLAAVRKVGIGTTFILMSGLAGTLTPAEKDGFAAIMQKPFTFDELQETVTQFQSQA